MLPSSSGDAGPETRAQAIEQVSLEQQVQLVQELDGHVLKCARDQVRVGLSPLCTADRSAQNANHTLRA
jgi:hypothetical protein